MIASCTSHTSLCHFSNIRCILYIATKHYQHLGYSFQHLVYKPFCSKKEEIKKEWNGVVGLEVHAQISSASKLFSGAATEFAAPVNTNVSLFDAAIPGTLPVLNRRCIEAGVLTALALSCTLNPVSLFDRKHYFYADLPAGYQITQQRLPLAHSGELNFHITIPGAQRKPYSKKCRLKQLQLEQDSGKSLHDTEACRSLVDLNRAGIPLMELVFEPDLENGEEAACLIKELIIILQCLGTCSCKMEEGALRVDANVSVNRRFEPLGVRTEVKNISSIRGVANAIQYEIKRQIETLEKGGVVINETRAWDDACRQTVPMRDKEEKQDYRFMPEPNLPPLRLLMDSDDTRKRADRNLVNVNELKKKIPELPAETRKRLVSQYEVSEEMAIRLVNENVLLKHFSYIMKENENRDAKLTANILLNELITVLHKNKLPLETSISLQHLGEMVDLLQSGKINLLSARKLLQEIVDNNPDSPSKLVETLGLLQITDMSEIDKLCTEVIEQNAKIVEQFLNGKTKVFNSLVGKIAKSTDNRVNVATVVEVLTNKLSDLKSAKKQVM